MTARVFDQAHVPRRTRAAAWKGAALPYLLLTPAIVLLTVLTLGPLLYSIVLSFFEAQLGRGLGQFVGFKHYATVLAERRFWMSALNTLVWVVGSVSSQLFLGVVLAIMLDRLRFASMFFRGALFIPWVMPVAVIAFLWRWILDPQNGIVNVTMRTAGLEWGMTAGWLSDPGSAMASALIVNAWRGVPFVLVMVLAALQGIPKDEYEAARTSGAGPLREVWFVALPNLKEILLTLALLRTMQIANNFSMMWLLTGGGPAESTEILPLLVYTKAFGSHALGEASALAVMLLVLLIIVNTMYMRLARERLNA
ncbi:MAG TPA: sugar ABC transporter permease [Burkholderiaceae bacterium]|nr:sugar ABC transporter permease [Burkholderiaceae bacterium]